MKFKDLNIDLETLSTEEKMSLLAEVRTALNMDASGSRVEVSEVAYDSKKQSELNNVDEIIDRQFEKYDEVFRALA